MTQHSLRIVKWIEDTYTIISVLDNDYIQLTHLHTRGDDYAYTEHIVVTKSGTLDFTMISKLIQLK